MTRGEIHEYFRKKLCDYLDGEFDDFCTCDDYYQPVVEDFEAETCVEDWCLDNGFELISCRGKGHDTGYEPYYKKGLDFSEDMLS